MKPLASAGESITVHTVSEFRNVVVVPNATAQDTSLSWAARGLLTFMLSMPQNWHFHEHDLVKRSPMGRDHLRSIVRELEAHGYVQRTRRRDASGRQCGSHWEVWARPIPSHAPPTGTPSTETPATVKAQFRPTIAPPTEKPSAAEPKTETPRTEQPSTENPSPYKTPNQQTPHQTNPPSSLRSEAPRLGGQRPPAAADGLDSGKGQRSRRIDPITAPLPVALEPHRQGIADFWAAKRTGSARTAAAFKLLVKNLERIQAQDPNALASQLELATQSGWSSITFERWEQFGRRESRRPGNGEPRVFGGHGSRAQANAAEAKRLLDQWEAQSGAGPEGPAAALPGGPYPWS